MAETKQETVRIRAGHMEKPGYVMVPIREDFIAQLFTNGKTDFKHGGAVDVKTDDVIGSATHLLIKAQGE